MDINKLRELIRVGEYIDKNAINSSEPLYSQWIFDVEFFTEKLEYSIKTMIFHQMCRIKRTAEYKDFSSILGFLRSLYNNSTNENRILPNNYQNGNRSLTNNSQSVFIIHGHDDSLIQEVKKCIEELGLNPIVLREQPDKGKTIIEKLEEYLGNCKCAVVLYTPCDIGKSKSANNEEQRARQNVVYEHGLFQGYLGRNRIMVLKKGNTVLPGDCGGVVYTNVETGEWKNNLKNNIKAIDKDEVKI